MDDWRLHNADHFKLTLSVSTMSVKYVQNSQKVSIAWRKARQRVNKTLKNANCVSGSSKKEERLIEKY